MEKDIYKLKLHETIEIKTGYIDYFVTRVPGGWIYFNKRLDSGQMNSAFVPLNQEFN